MSSKKNRYIAIAASIGILPLSFSGWTYFVFGPLDFRQFAYHVSLGPSVLIGPDLAVVLSGVLVIFGAPGLTYIIARRLLVPRIISLHQKTLALVVIVVVAVAGTVSTANAIGLPTFLDQLTYSEEADKAFFPPELAPSETVAKNLVLIYVESLEVGYQDETVFGSDLLEPLKPVLGSWYVSDGFIQLPGNSYTMAGLVSTQCGFPLRAEQVVDFEQAGWVPLPNSIGEDDSPFLENATCLGDILANEGYANYFLGGADLAFANKGNFLTSHGYKVLGWSNWEALGHNRSEWGLNDDWLLSYALSQWRFLHSTSKPYNLTVLTLDTHHPFGLQSETCRSQGAKDLAEITTCTARLLARFLQSAEDEGLLENTVVVMLGDHLAMKGQLEQGLRGKERRVFFAMSGQTLAKPNPGETFNHFDVFPTILSSLGLQTRDERAAWGVSLFAEERDPLVGDRFLSEIDLQRRSRILESLW